MARLLNTRFAPAPQRRPLVVKAPIREKHYFCQSCKIEVEPRLDSAGPYCPYCQQDLAVAMERGRMS